MGIFLLYLFSIFAKMYVLFNWYDITMFSSIQLGIRIWLVLILVTIPILPLSFLLWLVHPCLAWTWPSHSLAFSCFLVYCCCVACCFACTHAVHNVLASYHSSYALSLLYYYCTTMLMFLVLSYYLACTSHQCILDLRRKKLLIIMDKKMIYRRCCSPYGGRRLLV